MNMRVWLGFRRLQSRDLHRSRWGEWAVTYTQPLPGEPGPDVTLPRDVCHVEIVLEVSCSGARSCAYCALLAKRLHEAKQRQSFRSQQQYTVDTVSHLLSYSITGLAPLNTVYCTLNREYNESEWVFQGRYLRASQQKAVFAFLEAQKGKGFSRRAFYLNFAPRTWWCWGCARTSAVPQPRLSWWQTGCDFSPDPRAYAGHPHWFCSELAVAALQGCGLCENVAPASVSPNHLFWHTVDNPLWAATDPPVTVPFCAAV